MPANKRRISHPLLRYNKEDNEIHSVTCAGCGAALVANAIFATVKKQLPFPVNLSMERVVALHLCAKFSSAYHFAKDQFPFTSICCISAPAGNQAPRTDLFEFSQGLCDLRFALRVTLNGAAFYLM